MSFEEFIKTYFGDSFKPYPYQLEFLKDIQNNKKPFNLYNIHMKARQHSRRIEHMFRLYDNLLNNKSTLDLYLSLFFKFEVNENDKVELMIDEYSQPTGNTGKGSVTYDEEGNMIGVKLVFDTTDEAKDFYQEMKKALEVIKGMT